ncbi:MAG: ABC transporter ATP-binding protein [Methanoregulaceae archaeon]
MDPRLEVREVSFTYIDGPVVFSGVSFTVGAGEVFSILGPNGTGKSTLLKCCGHLLAPSSGEVLIEGRPLAELSANERAQALGYVPQTHSPPFPFPVRDFIAMGRAPYIGLFSTPARDDVDRAEQAMARVGIAHLADRPITQVSGGERQLALIARVLVQEPTIMLLDEPTSHLDFGNQLRILEVVRSLADEGITCLVATHYPDHAFITDGRSAILRDRTLSAVGSNQDVITEENLKRAYGIDVQVREIGPPVGRRICIPLFSRRGT